MCEVDPVDLLPPKKKHRLHGETKFLNDPYASEPRSGNDQFQGIPSLVVRCRKSTRGIPLQGEVLFIDMEFFDAVLDFCNFLDF